MSWLAEEDPLREAQAPSVRVNHVFPNSTFSGQGEEEKREKKKTVEEEMRRWMQIEDYEGRKKKRVECTQKTTREMMH